MVVLRFTVLSKFSNISPLGLLKILTVNMFCTIGKVMIVVADVKSNQKSIIMLVVLWLAQIIVPRQSMDIIPH